LFLFSSHLCYSFPWGIATLFQFFIDISSFSCRRSFPAPNLLFSYYHRVNLDLSVYPTHMLFFIRSTRLAFASCSTIQHFSASQLASFFMATRLWCVYLLRLVIAHTFIFSRNHSCTALGHWQRWACAQRWTLLFLHWSTTISASADRSGFFSRMWFTRRLSNAMRRARRSRHGGCDAVLCRCAAREAIARSCFPFRRTRRCFLSAWLMSLSNTYLLIWLQSSWITQHYSKWECPLVNAIRRQKCT
jgi:hypothetical protein